jgi:lysophospholipase L1-like esterase
MLKPLGIIMKFFTSNYFIFILVIFTMIYSQTTIKPDDPNIQYFGRVDRSRPDRVIFDWPGVSIRAVFEGTSCRAELEGRCCFDAFVDGVLTGTVRISGQKAVYLLAKGLTDRNHKLILAKRGETTVEPVSFFGFVLDNGKKLVPPPEPPARKIEFIGDSYTAGYANEYQGTACATEKADSIICEATNTNKAFGPLVARAFGAQYQIIAISGKGLVRNYNGIDPGKELPSYYDKILISSVKGGEKGHAWNFSSWKADVAIICIGINDFQGEPPYADTVKFDAAYEALLSRLRKQYPGVSIICCTTKVWPVDVLIPRIKNIVARQKAAGHTDVHFFEFVAGNSALYGHPSVHDHQAIADSLIPIVAKATEWRRTDMVRGK